MTTSEAKSTELSNEKTIAPAKQDAVFFERSVLQTILGMTALVSAALFYISWLYHRRYFEAFGLHANMIRLDARDYILNAKSALAINAIIIAVVILIRFFVDLRSRRFRFTIAIISLLGFLAGTIYLVTDIWSWGNKFGINIVGYRSAWVMLVFILVVLLYSTVASTLIYNRIQLSKSFQKIVIPVVWSSVLALGFLAISLTSSFIGSFEGKHDASITSRLPFVTIETKQPIGIGIQPDFLGKGATQVDERYFYYNLRLLAKEGSNIYLLRPEKGVSTPLVYMVDMSTIQSFSLGWSIPTTPTVKIN